MIHMWIIHFLINYFYFCFYIKIKKYNDNLFSTNNINIIGWKTILIIQINDDFEFLIITFFKIISFCLTIVIKTIWKPFSLINN